MKQEEKELLLKDLCARLPYGVFIQVNEVNCLDIREAITEGFIGGYTNTTMCQDYDINDISEFLDEGDIVKMYLRPMSSMTEEEKKELSKKYFRIYGDKMTAHYHSDGYWDDDTELCSDGWEDIFNWLNEHHFDYRGLIPMGLALEAKEGMYK